MACYSRLINKRWLFKIKNNCANARCPNSEAILVRGEKVYLLVADIIEDLVHGICIKYPMRHNLSHHYYNVIPIKDIELLGINQFIPVEAIVSICNSKYHSFIRSIK